MTKEELALIWFDYQGLTFAKVEKILAKFDAISKVSSALFEINSSIIFSNEIITQPHQK